MTTPKVERIETLIPHGRSRPDGQRGRHHCPGMWVIEYDERGVVAECNECGRVRNLTEHLEARAEGKTDG